ncbi:aminotransferase class V-fold PLP-dependent enzyme [Archangium violaceum]|uniref:aminotransferase class V-fold PLP-dependent enzyme n=1 Tax=Archangium violaceum TaxID=83451 RepID=UPI00194E0C18|nr:aminotransferase class V-fold PLP-dependent enzyme [Archangium violaceum]QRN96241.1 aminotransferase class V-fold PLP-dependent enzyme [Archangium violaceum]
MSASDFAALRARFPLFSERTYFATQCLGPTPSEMYVDLLEYARTLGLRNRSLPVWIERMGEFSRLLEQLLGAEPGSVALRDSVTAAQAAIASAVSPRPERHRILYSAIDFHSSRYLWSAQARRGFSVEELRPEDGVLLRPEEVLRHLDERVAIVALSLVSPRTGALLEVAPVVKAAHDAGALVVLDAYQAVGVVPVDVRRLGADVVVGGTHKWLGGGGLGLAFLYVRPALAERLEPAFPGWIGHREMVGFAETYEPAPGSARFQQGTPAIEPIYTGRAGLRFVLETGVERLRERSVALTTRMMARAHDAGLPVKTPREPERRGGMLCFDMEDGAVLVERMAALGIDIDTRPGAGVRVSPHPCNTEEECDRVIDELARLSRR